MTDYVTITFFCLFLLSCTGENSESPKRTERTDPISILDAQITEQPDHPGLYFERGKIHIQQNKLGLAIADFKKAYSLDRTFIEAGHQLANTYLDNQESRLALETLKSMVEEHPTDLLSKLKLSEFLLICKQYSGALQAINSLHRADPENAEGFFMEGLILEQMDRPDEAMTSFQNATKADPDLLDAWIHIGQILDKKGDPDALRYYDAALLSAPEHLPTLHAKAISLAQQDLLNEAKSIYQRILTLDAYYSDAYFNLGLILLDQDSTAEAKTHFNLVVKTDPQYISGYFYRGFSSELMMDLTSARLDYQTALRLDPKYKKAQEGLERVTPPEKF